MFKPKVKTSALNVMTNQIKVSGTSKPIVKQQSINSQASLGAIKPLQRNSFIIPTIRTTHLNIIQQFQQKRNKSDDKVKITDLCKAERVDYDFSALGGMQSVFYHLNDAVMYLQDPEGFKKTGAEVPNGYLLYGPPGTGKTYIAKAVGGEADAVVFMVTGSQLIGEFVGEGERLMRELFDLAGKEKKCVLIIDEIDSIAEKRFSSVTTGSQLHHNTLVNQFLTLVTQKKSSVVLIATTNKEPKDLDPAVTRDGRFDRHVYVPLPEQEQRKEILDIYIKNKALDKDVKVEMLAKLSPHYSGARLKRWVNEAALYAMKRGSNEIAMDDFDHARTIMHLGVSSSHAFDPVVKRATAIHEAGHAMVAHLLGEYVYKITILAGAQSNGYMESLPDEKQIQTKQVLLNQICICLSGRAAEKVFGIEKVGSRNDFENAKTIAAKMVIEEGMGESLSGLAPEFDVEKILQQEMQRAETIIVENKANIECIVNALLKHKQLDHQALLDVLVGKEPAPPKYTQQSQVFMRPTIVSHRMTRDMVTKEDIGKVIGIDPSTFNVETEGNVTYLNFKDHLTHDTWCTVRSAVDEDIKIERFLTFMAINDNDGFLDFIINKLKNLNAESAKRNFK